MSRIVLALAAALSFTGSAWAEWSVVNSDSRLSFVSVKAGTVAEVHHFTRLEGALSEDGSFELTIPLASVETLIPIRNERMRDMLFDVDRFPSAQLQAQLDMASLKALSPGGQLQLAAEATLSLHGKETPLTFETVVAQLDSETLLVTSLQPLVLNADKLGLGGGVEQLREIAGLPSISPAVPISFRLTLRRGPASAHAVSQR